LRDFNKDKLDARAASLWYDVIITDCDIINFVILNEVF